MDSRIDAIYGRQSIDKKDSISIESQFEFCRYELKGGEGKEYKDFAAMSLKAVRVRNTKIKVTPARTLSAPTSSGFCRTSGWA